jgi:tetratricopeptide (TPR) repeat protein
MMQNKIGILIGAVCWLLAGKTMADAPADSAKQLRNAWAQSLSCEQNGDFVRALAPLRSMPRDYAICLRMGWLEYRAGHYPASSVHYMEALGTSPCSLEARLGLLLPLLAMNHHAEAERIAREVLQESPANPLAAARLATSLRKQGRLGEAETILVPALKNYPTDISLLTELALVCAARHRASEAHRLFGEILLLDPGNDAARRQTPQRRSLDNPDGAARFLSPLPGNLSTNRAIGGGAAIYAGGISYEGTVYRDHAWFGGASGWLDLHRTHLFEAGIESMDITYKYLPRLSQLDATAAYANFSLAGLKPRLGGHYIATDDGPTDGAFAVFGGLDWNPTRSWSLGLDGFHTRYPRYGPPLDVAQLTPHTRFELAQGPDWCLNLDISGNWIQTGRSLPPLDQQSFFSGEGSLSLRWGGWTFSGTGWAGEQAFAARNAGYTIYNVAEKHTGGCGADIRRALGKNFTVDFRYRREEYREIFTRASAAGNLFLAAVGLHY